MVAFALSAMPEVDFAAAALPLLDDGIVDMLEWSFDMGWGPAGTPDWLDALLDDFAADACLLGHGVSFSLLAGDWTPHHAGWLDRLRVETERRPYRHVSEHIGFLGAGKFSFAAPLPMPYCAEVVALGQERMALLADAAGVPVGLENLATSLSVADGQHQGALLDDLLEPVDGFVVLDVHNLWAQCWNLGLDPAEIVETYPLDRVREIHVSGGAWDETLTTASRRIRRDTHDADAPDEVVELLEVVAPQCPALEVVVYERLGQSLADPATHDAYRRDVRRVRDTVAQW